MPNPQTDQPTQSNDQEASPPDWQTPIPEVETPLVEHPHSRSAYRRVMAERLRAKLQANSEAR